MGFYPLEKIPGTDEVVNMLRLLICQSQIEPVFPRFYGPTEGYALVLQYAEPKYYQVQSRVNIAVSLAYRLWHLEADVFRMALTRDSIPSSAIKLTTPQRRSLLHGVATRVVRGTKIIDDENDEDFLTHMKGSS